MSVFDYNKNEAEDSLTISGHVKWFDAAKGYGFIDPQDPAQTSMRDVLLHISSLRDMGRDTAHEGARITCKIAKRAKGWQVTEIESLDAGGDPAHVARSEAPIRSSRLTNENVKVGDLVIMPFVYSTAPASSTMSTSIHHARMEASSAAAMSAPSQWWRQDSPLWTTVRRPQSCRRRKPMPSPSRVTNCALLVASVNMRRSLILWDIDPAREMPAVNQNATAGDVEDDARYPAGVA